MSGEPQSFEVARPEEARALLQTSVGTKAKFQVWTEGQRFLAKSRVERIHETGPNFYLGIQRDEKIVEFDREIRAAGIENVMCSLHLPTDILFFEAEPKVGGLGSFQLKVVNPVYRLQRRRSLRVPFSGRDVPIATIRIGADDPETLKFPVLNAAEGGIAITVQDEKDFKLFPVGLEIHEIHVTIAGVEIKCPGDVRHVQEIASSSRLKKFYKIGLRFDGIPQESMERLARFVFETSAKFVGRR